MVEIGMWNDPDRKQSVLTQKEREYLLGRRSIDGQAERNTRFRIRQRLINALLDIQLLENSNRDQTVFDDLGQVANHQRIDLDLKISFASMLYDLILLDEDVSDEEDELELIIRKALMRSAPYEEFEAEGVHLGRTITVDIEVEDRYSGDLEEMKERVRSGDASILELSALLQIGNLDEDDPLFEEVERQLEEKSGDNLL